MKKLSWYVLRQTARKNYVIHTLDMPKHVTKFHRALVRLLEKDFGGSKELAGLKVSLAV